MLIKFLTILTAFLVSLNAEANVTVTVTLDIETKDCERGVNVVELSVGDLLQSQKYAKESIYTQSSCNNKKSPQFHFIIDNLNKPLLIDPIVNANGKEIKLRSIEVDLTQNEEKWTSDPDIHYNLSFKTSYKCTKEFYGQYCEKHCVEDDIRHYCDEMGNKKCKSHHIYLTDKDICIYDTCSKMLDYCMNNGVCINPVKETSKASCECPDGYTGLKCEAMLTDEPTTVETTQLPSTTKEMPAIISAPFTTSTTTTEHSLTTNAVQINQKDMKKTSLPTSPQTILIGIFIVSVMCIILVIILGVVAYTSCRRGNTPIKVNPHLTGPPNMNNIFAQSGNVQPIYLDGNGQFGTYDDTPYYQKSQNFVDPRNFNSTIDQFPYPTDTIRSQSSAMFMTKQDQNYFQPDNESLILSPTITGNKPTYHSISESINDDIALSNLYSKYNTDNVHDIGGTLQNGKYSFMHGASIGDSGQKYNYQDCGYQSSTLNKRYSQINFMNYNYPITLPKQFSESFYDTWKTPYSDFHLKDYPDTSKMSRKDSKPVISPTEPIRNHVENSTNIQEINKNIVNESDDLKSEKKSSPKPPIEFS